MATRDAVFTVVSELTANAHQHGRGCYVMAQTHTGRESGQPGLELAIADIGPGFADTLRAYGTLTEADALARAFEEQVTGTGDSHRGFGLYWVRDAVSGYPAAATIEIASFDGFVRLTKGSGLYQEVIPDSHGVFATARFSYQTPSV